MKKLIKTFLLNCLSLFDGILLVTMMAVCCKKNKKN